MPSIRPLFCREALASHMADEKNSSLVTFTFESTIDSEGFKGGTRGAPIMPRDAVSRTANEKLVTIVANRMIAYVQMDIF